MGEKANKQSREIKRREFFQKLAKRAAYVAPLILTFKARKSFAQTVEIE